MSKRDSQRQRVYDSEYSVGIWPEEYTKTRDISGCQAYVDSITRSAWWKRRSGVRKVPVETGARGGRAWAGYSNIRTAPYSRNYRVMLHELAHILTSSSYNNFAPHGPEYCANFVAITRQFAGKDVGDALKASLRANRVKVRGVKAATRTISKPCPKCQRRFTTGTGWTLTQISGVPEFCTKRCLQNYLAARIKKNAS